MPIYFLYSLRFINIILLKTLIRNPISAKIFNTKVISTCTTLYSQFSSNRKLDSGTEGVFHLHVMLAVIS